MADERRPAALISVDLHPAKRWSALVGIGLCCGRDLPTVAAWARQAGTCETQLRMRCRLAGVTAKSSLDLLRMLRAAYWREILGGDLRDYLDIGDVRTMAKLFARVGLEPKSRAPMPLEVLAAQKVVHDAATVEELRKVLTVSTASMSR